MTSDTNIINTHDQLVAAGGGVAIIVSYGGTRTTYVDGWSVYRVRADGTALVTDPGAAWHHHGKMWFSNFGERGETFHARQNAALLKAQAWVAEQGWCNGPWVRNRMRDYVPCEINKRFPIPRR